MMRNIGPMNPDIPPFGEMSLNDSPITHYMDEIDLPDGKAQEACKTHIESGAASELLGEFILAGCHFPAEGEEQMIRTAFVCPGPGIIKKCRLSLVQATAEGHVLSKGTVNS